MTKKQKIWLSVFLAMFVVPEVLWSPVSNFYYQFIKGMSVSNVSPLRSNFLQKPEYLFLLKLVFIIQTIGLVSSIIIIKKANINKLSKIIVLIIFLILSLSSIFVLWYAFNNSYNIG